MTLHTWNKAGTSAATLQQCLAQLRHGDTLLLLEDGCYALLDAGFLQQLQPRLAAGAGLCVLAEDLAARDLGARAPQIARRIDYAGFVALALQHDRVVNWV